VFTPPTLRGSAVQLEPIRPDHLAGLAAAADEDRSSFGYTDVSQGEDQFAGFIATCAQLLASGRQIPFAVRLLAEDRIVGATRFMDLEVFTWPPPWPPGVNQGPPPTDDTPPSVGEIGGTWYAASVQRTIVNTECKLLLLSHAFDHWQSLRVTLKTDARNERSRTAIERIGASFEGIRRVHSAAVDGSVRDTAYYSIVSSEWPTIKVRLTEMRDRR